MHNSDSEARLSRRLRHDLQLIREGFVGYLLQQHYSASTICHHQNQLVRAAQVFGRSITTLSRNEVPALIRRYSLGRTRITKAMRRGALHAWLRFLGRFHTSDLPPRCQSWLDDYARFLEADRGLLAISRDHYVRDARRYLRWQFGRNAPVWKRVRPEDIWRYAAKLRRAGYNPKALNTELCILRQFLRFVHLRGQGSPMLAKAVPTFSERGRRSPRSDVASEEERRRFLYSFKRDCAEGRRDYAMALCMLDLGLRCVEVVRLRLSSIDWERRTLTVPPAKSGRGRILPLPRHVASALRSYRKARPVTEHDQLFVSLVVLAGRPITTAAVASAMRCAYRRCGIDRWGGTHPLRHSFATRLLRHGANIKEIADLLGHRLLHTTNRYAHAATHDLQALVRPWPE